MSRLPVRVRVTLAFAGVMAILLGIAGVVVYVRVADALDDAIAQGLRARVGDLRAGPARVVEEGQVLALGDAAALLTDEETARARRAPVLIDRPHLRGTDDPVRLLAAPVDGGVAVAGTTVDDRNETLRTLAMLLLIGGPIMLALASLAGYGAAAAALRPVERMRRRAAAIQAGEPGARLPVGPANDEIGRLGATLNAMLARLEEAYARERAFVADASHELRTPLAILKAELELALKQGRSAEELAAAVQSAAEETDRLVALAEDLLVLARVEEGHLPVRPATLDAAELLGRFGPAVAPDGLTVRADPERLNQALANLVDNARRYGATRVELAAERVNGRVELHVRDDGPGFPPEFLDVAFERFSRADPARGRAGGAGLGLAIVDVIARAHGGAAGARNRPAGGADVWISLPCGS